MILASKKTVGKRILPLLLAMVLLLLSLPATAFAASLTAVVTAVKGRCLNHLTNGPKMGCCGCSIPLVAAPGFEPGTLRV